MFGYIIVNKQDLKVKESECYQSYYCGLCKELQKRHGLTGRIGLNYDMNFLLLLLTGLYEPKTRVAKRRCVVHPIGRQVCRSNRFSAYAADMNVILMYYKCLDDWHDDKEHGREIYARFLKRHMKVLRKKYPEKIRSIEAVLREMNDHEEQQEKNIDKMARFSGRILGTVFAYQKDEWADELYTIGFYLGKFIYLCDAYEDLYEDIKNGRYNPFHDIYQDEDFEEKSKDLMSMMMAECCKAFEILPIIKNAEILRNILYSGVWSRYEMIHRKRLRKKG